MRLFGEITRFLSEQGIEDPAGEAELLITQTLHIDQPRLYTEDIEISPETLSIVKSLAARRALGEPLQYIIGHVEFYGLKIYIGKGVLIPRPETELLVEEVIKKIAGRTTSDDNLNLRILDLCTGSGCIAIALTKNLPRAEVYGVDMSDAALGYALRNAEQNSVKNVSFLKGDLFGPVVEMGFNCIVCNPPYVKRGDIPGLQQEIRDYEPIEALDGGTDGLDFYRRILGEAPRYLYEDSFIACEIGFDQGLAVEGIATEAGIRDVRILKDYAGLDRIFIGSR